MEENKDVVITIRSSQMVEGNENDGTELITRGTYAWSKEGARFTYMESEITGLGDTKTVFLIKPDEAVLTRKGTVNSRMVFRPGENKRFAYETEYGILRLGLDTHRLDSRLDEHGGSVEIEYDLDFEQSVFSRNSFQIQVREIGVKQ